MRIRTHFPTHHQPIRIGLSCFVAAICLGCNGNVTDTGSHTNEAPASSTSTAPITQTLELALVPIQNDQSAFALQGLSTAQTENSATKDWRVQFKVYVGTNIASDQPAMLGSYAVDQQQLVFTPEYGLEPGQTYTAVFAGINNSGKLRRTFEMPTDQSPTKTAVTEVFPSREQLPQNLLKFYLHFSAPMRAGDSYRYIHLLDENGKPITDPFLELDQELWDDSRTRFTLLFDPGRIKKGLKPHEDVGPPLLPGRHYTLVIDADWCDTQGNPLAAEFRKPFDVSDPDATQPSIDGWQIEPPQANTTRPLVIRFDESLDRALLERIFVVAADKVEVVGKIDVTDAETIWRFFPDQPWPVGKFAVIVETTLEDLAGNSLGRPFEVDLSQNQPVSDGEKTRALLFEIAETRVN
ncbi:hypothetical protein CA54_42590 [Symmachiella macrocystis]|uniref:SbsA Ig-like domain-containing protein n=1 Tax=Symmachiella macrocystis TaxID=2527985 RepID=A0A5C6BCL5_9PLAN|nr:hypothetical protein [Symmachiella macrocystis]TWU09019.1 hypothetical protein CA54_42590 [Symmachiella macrocystis]